MRGAADARGAAPARARRSHCLDQKETFGAEAAKELPYVECFPGGFHTGQPARRPHPCPARTRGGV